jgi:hypothetical protein
MTAFACPVQAAQKAAKRARLSAAKGLRAMEHFAGSQLLLPKIVSVQ